MKNLNNYIQEKFLIDTEMQPEEEVMCIHKDNNSELFEYDLFIHTLEKMHEDHKSISNDLIIYVDNNSKKTIYTLYDSKSTIFYKEAYIDKIFTNKKNIGHYLAIALHECSNKKGNISKNGVNELIEKSKIKFYDVKKFKYFEFWEKYRIQNTLKELYNMYIWPSVKDNCIKILLTNKTYKSLLDKGQFI